jgi:uncharacterized membrane protein
MIHNMHMNRQRSSDRIDSLLQIQINALAGDPTAKRAMESLTDIKSDLHGLIDEIFDELEAIALQEETDAEAGIEGR